MVLVTLGIAAALLQVLGYAFYIWCTLRKETDPNPTSWLMWAYGTTLVTVLEFDRGASWVVLCMPVLCAVCRIFVALHIRCKVGTLLPTHWADWSAFFLDVGLTSGYVFAWTLNVSHVLTEGQRGVATLAFLVLSNATTVTTFAPMIRDLWSNPHHEHPLPWFTWTTAYFSLAAATFLQYGFWSEFMIYPIVNLGFHLAVYLLVRRKRVSIAEAKSSL